jgi:hypothetical protein
MNFFNKLDPLAFMISLAIGFFLAYIFGPRPTILYQYPTPNNTDTAIYKDDLNNCYKYQSAKVTCPSDKKHIHSIPIQVR